MSKAVLISVNRPHTDNIKSGLKTSELRTRPPKFNGPMKFYCYETTRNGGCGKVIMEWVCKNMTEWRICMGIPAHLPKVAQVTCEDILKYTNNGEKELTEIEISDLVIYDNPKELSEFIVERYPCLARLKRPPQSWFYVEELR